MGIFPAKKEKPEPRTNKATPLKEAFDEMFKAFHLTDRVKKAEIINEWPRLMGKMIASNTEKLYIADCKLFVRIHSAPLRDQMFRQRNEILEILKTEFGKIPINEVVFI